MGERFLERDAIAAIELIDALLDLSVEPRPLRLTLADPGETFAKDFGPGGVAAGLYRFVDEGFVLRVECGLVVHGSGI